jgi:hypothetical protein
MKEFQMIHKLILITGFVMGVAYGSTDNTLDLESKATVNKKIQYSVWKPAIDQKDSGKSCKDGNCISESKCFTKDGVAYKCLTSVHDKIKKYCRKL